MKRRSFILITILIIGYSCKKEPDITLPPFLDITFENVPVSYEEPNDSDTVFAKCFVSPLRISITEYHLEPLKLKNPDIEQRIFAFQVITPEDSEVFVKGKNIIPTSGSTGFNKSYIVTQIENKFAIPVKISERVIKNNDTIEQSKETGYIKVQYKSGYSGRIVRKTLRIK